jgi:hypothetical protein
MTPLPTSISYQEVDLCHSVVGAVVGVHRVLQNAVHDVVVLHSRHNVLEVPLVLDVLVVRGVLGRSCTGEEEVGVEEAHSY